MKDSDARSRMVHLLWCTVRPAKFKEAHTEWISRAAHAGNVITYVAVNRTEHGEDIARYLDTGRNFVMTLNIDQIGVCLPSYQLSSRLGMTMGSCRHDDIVVFASDDFLPPTDWDAYLVAKMEGVGAKALFVRDGYQLPDSSNMLHPAITLPVMTYSCLRRLNGVIYHPAYRHMFSDCELYENLRDLDLLIDDRLSDETVFEHMHHAAGKRMPDQVDQMYHAQWAHDQEIWNRRRQMPAEERIRVSA